MVILEIRHSLFVHSQDLMDLISIFVVYLIIDSEMSEPQIVIVSKKSEEKAEDTRSEVEIILQEMKMTSNLINEISFNSTINRFEYLQDLLRKEHDKFIKSITEAVNNQKEVVRQMKVIHKQIKDIRPPSLNFNRILAQEKDILRLKGDSDKNLKLTQGMLVALSKMQDEIMRIERPKSKNEEDTQQIL